jgi:hypothetical protein
MDFTPFSGFEVKCGKRHENIPKNRDAFAPYKTGCKLHTRQEGWGKKTNVVDPHWGQFRIYILVRLSCHKVLKFYMKNILQVGNTVGHKTGRVPT